MTYRLYRLAQPGDDIADGTLLGSFSLFDDALAARDADTVDLFAVTGAGEVLHAHHQIVGPASVHPVSTAIERPTPAGRQDIVDIRDWLGRIHRLV
jgi:hypothetical protein